MACEIDTLKPDFSIKNTANADDKDTENAAGRALMLPKSFKVSAVFCPLMTEPRAIKILAIVAATEKRSIFVPTAVPKMLEASFAPNDQPKNKPLDKKNK